MYRRHWSGGKRSIPFRVFIVLSFLLSLLALQGGPAAADTPGDGNLSGPPPEAVIVDPRLDGQLNELAGAAQGISSADVDLLASGLLTDDGKVAVSIYVDESLDGLQNYLEGQDVIIANVGEDVIEAYVPYELLGDVAAQAGVRQVLSIIPPQAQEDANPNYGTILSQGVTVHNADNWHASGYNGSGVKVGVIDVGFTGYAGLIGTELPAPTGARCYTSVGVFTSNLSDCDVSGGSVHGAGVAESIVDIAPAVQIYISNAPSFTDLQNTVTWMISQGVDVINHSVGWTWDGPGDGTSPYSNSPKVSVANAVAGGILWANSAGNSNGKHWTGPWSSPDADSYLDFTSGNEVNYFYASAGSFLNLEARWQDSWSNASKNYDLQLYQWDGANWNYFTQSANPQSGSAGHTPYERLAITIPTSGYYGAVIYRNFAGADATWFDVATWRNDLQFPTPSNSIGNPAELVNAGLLTVGAAHWSTTSTIETFSSRGPTRNGSVKPDIVGADAADTASYGTGANAFYGTSQASPHVAALAALVLDRFSYTPAQVATYLKDNALPRGSPDPNNTWGHGFAYLPDVGGGDTTPPTITQKPAPKFIPNARFDDTLYQILVDYAGTDPSGISAWNMQYSVNGGAWAAANPLLSQVRYLNPASSSVQYRVRAQDGAGNWSDWANGQGQKFRTQYVQQNDAAITYSGYWAPWVHAVFLSGGARYASGAGKYFTFTYNTATDVGFSIAGCRLPNAGIYKIYVNNTLVETVDQYSATPQCRRNQWDSQHDVDMGQFQNGTYTVKIEVTGTKNQASQHTNVNIDAVVILKKVP